MKLLQRLKRIEEVKAPTYSQEEQKDLLRAYIEIETYFGNPPSEEEIEAERERLSRPHIEPTKEEIKQKTDEVKALCDEASAEWEKERNN